MMGIGPREAGAMTYWQYSAMRYVWNERHSTGDDDSDIEAPSEDFVRERMLDLQRAGIAGTRH